MIIIFVWRSQPRDEPDCPISYAISCPIIHHPDIYHSCASLSTDEINVQTNKITGYSIIKIIARYIRQIRQSFKEKDLSKKPAWSEWNNFCLIWSSRDGPRSRKVWRSNKLKLNALSKWPKETKLNVSFLLTLIKNTNHKLFKQKLETTHKIYKTDWRINISVWGDQFDSKYLNRWINAFKWNLIAQVTLIYSPYRCLY